MVKERDEERGTKKQRVRKKKQCEFARAISSPDRGGSFFSFPEETTTKKKRAAEDLWLHFLFFTLEDKRVFPFFSLFSVSLFCPSPPLPLPRPLPPLFRPLRASFSSSMPFSKSAQIGPVANGGDKVRIDRARGARGCSSLVVDRRIDFVLLRSISSTPSWSLSTLYPSSAPRNWQFSAK